MATSSSPSLQVMQMTPAQRALALPEILSSIFSQKSEDSVYLFNTGSESSDLLNFALVNKTWYNEAIRVLWGHPAAELAAVMSGIPPQRRQYYANLIWWAHVLNHPRNDHFGPEGSLHGLVFPHLTRLSVTLYTNQLYVIPIAHPETWIKDMYFRKRLLRNGSNERDLDIILDIISKFMPATDELYLRYEGPNSHLTGLVMAPSPGRALPGLDTHWFMDENPGQSPEDLSYGYEEPSPVESGDAWGESNWAE